MAINYRNFTPIPDLEMIENRIKSLPDTLPTDNELKTILSCIDLTSLEGKDTPHTIQELCKKALYANVAAVCVYPTLVKEAKAALAASAIKVAAVAGGFPSGQLPLFLKEAEVNYALSEGADEIDFVISRNEFLQENYLYTEKEITAVKKQCHKATLKVILETGELESLDKIALASRIAIDAGADFIKTSTGKTPKNATLPAVYTLLNTIKACYGHNGIQTGIKPSGGITDVSTAVQYLRLTEQIAGKEWLQPNLFRIGASRLVDQLLTKNKNTNGY